MKYRQLGKTGLKVSQVALGTVELGMGYGFPGSSHYEKPEPSEAIRIIHRALELGINLIDTARAYGSSEELIGRALRQTRHSAVIATKLSIPDPSGNRSTNIRAAILASVDASLQALQMEAVDLLQIHNTSAAILGREDVIRGLEEAQKQGKVRFLGASGSVCEEISLAVLETDTFEVLQVPFNLLDRRIADRVLPRAVEREVGVLVRSAFLRGVLTDSINVPAALTELREAAHRARKLFTDEISSLSELALRFCLSSDGVSSVIVGVRSIAELESNVADANRGTLSPDQRQRLRQIFVKDTSLLDPQNWTGLI